MPEELDLLLTVCKKLHTAGFEYMLTGSMASNYYTIPRMTRDIDIVLDLSAERLDDFAVLFEDEYYIDKQMISDELSRKGMFNIIHNKLIIKTDFILLKDSLFHRKAFNRKLTVKIFETEICIITAEDLAIAKMLWAKDSLSEIQICDVANLLSSDTGMEMDYLEHWVTALGLQEVYHRVKQL